MTEIIVSVITSITAIVVAVIGAINISHRKADEKHRKEEEKLAEIRSKEFRLGMDMQSASIDLSDVIAIAVTGGHTNGNVEEARKRAHEAKRAYYNFINSIASETLAHR